MKDKNRPGLLQRLVRGPQTNTLPATRHRQGLESASGDEVEAFLAEVQARPPVQRGDGRGRLVFSLDATASRQHTWDQAMSLTAEMFLEASRSGSLDVQLAYYRGLSECRAAPWLSSAPAVVRLMQKVSCQAGRTQIGRLLRHTAAEAGSEAVHAMVFIGDCCEEPLDQLAAQAGKLKLLGVPLFIFQEGYDANASLCFAELARLSGGAHCRFDANAAAELGALLNAVAVYATGGQSALRQLEARGSRSATQLLEQLGS